MNDETLQEFFDAIRADDVFLLTDMLNREPELRFQKAGQMKTAVETLTMEGQEAGPEALSSVSRANRSKFPNFRGTRAPNFKTPIAITLVVLFLAASLGIFYTVRGRISGNSHSARNSTFAYKGRALDVKQIARELGVRYVLEGSVRRAELPHPRYRSAY